ncbi:MAG: leucine-rich repeat domain-containing protein, partial [Bacteroidota bacterium]
MRNFYLFTFCLSLLLFCPTIHSQAHPSREGDKWAALFSTLGDRTVPLADSLALVDFYTSTNGANWTTKTYWLTGRANTWYGVKVENGRVTGLFLEENALKGAIPASLGNLTALKEIRLYFNQLSGSIPTSLGNLTALQRLDLSYNQVSGSIPAELGKLTALQRLNLYSNQLSGSIPTNLGNVTALQDLNLSFNQL